MRMLLTAKLFAPRHSLGKGSDATVLNRAMLSPAPIVPSNGDQHAEAANAYVQRASKAGGAFPLMGRASRSRGKVGEDLETLSL